MRRVWYAAGLGRPEGLGFLGGAVVVAGQIDTLVRWLSCYSGSLMPTPVNPVRIEDETGDTVRAKHLVGVDESESGHESEPLVVAAVRSRRDDDIQLVRALIENELQPFIQKSATIVRHGNVTEQDRLDRVESFISDIADTPITWAAIVCRESSKDHNAAAVCMAAKKALTGAQGQYLVSGDQNPAVFLHDGTHDSYSGYDKRLRKQATADFDPSFQRHVSPMHLTFLRGADRTYPQVNAADYIAGFLRAQLQAGCSVRDLGYDNLEELNQSWIRAASEQAPIYRLEKLRPVREEEIRTRVLSWILGKGRPPNPTPTTHDPTRERIEEIEDTTVRDYLLEQI